MSVEEFREFQKADPCDTSYECESSGDCCPCVELTGDCCRCEAAADRERGWA